MAASSRMVITECVTLHYECWGKKKQKTKKQGRERSKAL